MQTSEKTSIKRFVLIIIVCLLLISGCTQPFRNTAEIIKKTANTTLKTENKEKDIAFDETIDFGNCEITFTHTEHEELNNNKNKKYRSVFYTWKNKTDEEMKASSMFRFRIFQDGVQQQFINIISFDDDNTDRENLILKPDAELKNVKRSFSYESDSDVKIEIRFVGGQEIFVLTVPVK